MYSQVGNDDLIFYIYRQMIGHGYIYINTFYRFNRSGTWLKFSWMLLILYLKEKTLCGTWYYCWKLWFHYARSWLVENKQAGFLKFVKCTPTFLKKIVLKFVNICVSINCQYINEIHLFHYKLSFINSCHLDKWQIGS